MTATPLFSRLLEDAGTAVRYHILRGGTRSGKTYAILQLLLLMAIKNKGILISVVSETYPHLRRGAIADLERICRAEGLPWDRWWSKGLSTLTVPGGGSMEFFSADAPGKVHGPARDILFLNEAQNIRKETARQLFVRTRGRVFMDYNPVRYFWAITEYEPRPDSAVISSTYRNNPFLTREQVREIESYRGDKAWWRVYGEGLTGMDENAVLDFTQEEGFDFGGAGNVVAGLDFGFTNDPTASVLVAIDKDRREIHASELLYRRGLTNPMIAEALKESLTDKGMGRIPVYCDAAEPKSIEELRQEGVSATACAKTRSVTEQLQWLRGWTLKVDKESTDLIRELRGYTWATDKDGSPLNIPAMREDHAIDALRYATWTRAGNQGLYNLRIK